MHNVKLNAICETHHKEKFVMFTEKYVTDKLCKFQSSLEDQQ
jgi:hypothetical protein